MSEKRVHPWTYGLIDTLRDTSKHIISSDLAIGILDKYPKAKHHYLILPVENIPSIYHLGKFHIPLLEELHLLAINLLEVKRLEQKNFRFGFHAEPSMQRLHLHAISQDFNSNWLKTKKHWNSFNTGLFIPYKDLCEELRQNGCIKRLDKEVIGKYARADLLCNQCDYVAMNMPTLKGHLYEHWLDNQQD